MVITAEAEQPLDKIDEALRESFAKDIAEQASRLDELAKQLITLDIAIPGLYAAILKLVSGETATVAIWDTFSCKIKMKFWPLKLG